MPKNMETKSIEQLMAEADELMVQINADVIKDMEEAHRLAFEKHAQNFQKIKSEVHGEIGEKGDLEINSGSEGMHEAIQDIVKAFKGLTKFMSESSAEEPRT